MVQPHIHSGGRELSSDVKSLPTAPSTVTRNVTAIGIGITSLDVSNKFYVSAHDFGKGSRMNFPTWEEDIMSTKNGGPAPIPMKFKDERSTKSLPVKLQFAVLDPKATLARVVSVGGSAAEGVCSKEGTIWGKDPDGYLLELVPSSIVKGAVLAGVGYGRSDAAKSAAFFSNNHGRYDAQSSGQSTKIVSSAPSIDGLKDTIIANGGSLIKEIPAELRAISGAAAWTTAQRQAFANDLTNPQLIAVTDNVNQAKSDSGPEDWKPPLASYYCTYARMWVKVKSVYSLTVTSAEKSALVSMLGSC
ncbi:hypothetical protein BLS_000118 [Venturia inaequalis]|uniref:GmrSD restriction endonucleases C-terminal domain-containing protein n=1 Tax=Venturia inaequalis TaxID=5025 RepID=A0A8H3YLG3_VENIN|nr:hypothetical protein BLS_000118 [Venturia inaequalis]